MTSNAPTRSARRCHLGSSWSLVLGALLTVSAAASAEPKAEPDEADRLFADARQLLAEGKPEQACPKFEQSQKIDPAAGTLINLARCYALVGRTASAWATYRAAASLSSAAGQTKREHVARAQADALEPELARLALHLPSPMPAGFEIVLDEAPWLGGASATPVDPGPHRIVVRASGFLEWSERFEAVPHQQLQLDIPPLRELPAAAALKAPSASLPVTPMLGPREPASAHPAAANRARPRAKTRNSPGPQLRSLGLLLSGAGIVGLGASVAFGLRARQLNAESRKDNQCESTGCDRPGLELNHAALNAASIATVAFVSGAALSAAGVTLYLLGRTERSSSTASLGIQPAVTARGGSLVVTGSL